MVLSLGDKLSYLFPNQKWLHFLVSNNDCANFLDIVIWSQRYFFWLLDYEQ